MIHTICSYTEGSDFIGPNPPALTLMAGQSASTIQCATVTILDDSIPQGERNFSISIGSMGGNGGGGGVRVSPDLPSTEINIAVDPNDGEWTMLYLAEILGAD